MTTDEIYSAMKADLQERSGTALREGGDMSLRLHAVASQLETLWAHADYVARQSFPQTAGGTYLDYHAQMRGLCRVQAARASGSVRFSLTAAAVAAVPIPAGTLCCDESGVCFATDADAVIAAGSASVNAAVTAVETGERGNAEALTVTRMVTPPPGVASCTNPSPFTGGADAEDDESLRARILYSYAHLATGANAGYYLRRALEVPGIVRAVVLPSNRGAGTVDVVVASKDGLPTEAQLSKVTAVMNLSRGVCVDVDVISPTTVTVPVSVSLMPAPGHTFAEISEAVEEALLDYFSGYRLGENILRAELCGVIYAVPGVLNYSISAPASDVSITETQLPVAGTLTITEMS